MDTKILSSITLVTMVLYFVVMFTYNRRPKAYIGKEQKIRALMLVLSIIIAIVETVNIFVLKSQGIADLAIHILCGGLWAANAILIIINIYNHAAKK